MKHVISQELMQREILELFPMVASLTQDKVLKTKAIKLPTTLSPHPHTLFNICAIIYINKTSLFHCFHCHNYSRKPLPRQII